MHGDRFTSYGDILPTTPWLTVGDASWTQSEALEAAAALADGLGLRPGGRLLVAATGPRSRRTHFLPKDVLCIVWKFLRPAPSRPRCVQEMASCRVYDRLELAPRTVGRPALVQALQVARPDAQTDGLDQLFTEFNVDRSFAQESRIVRVHTHTVV